VLGSRTPVVQLKAELSSECIGPVLVSDSSCIEDWPSDQKHVLRKSKSKTSNKSKSKDATQKAKKKASKSGKKTGKPGKKQHSSKTPPPLADPQLPSHNLTDGSSLENRSFSPAADDAVVYAVYAHYSGDEAEEGQQQQQQRKRKQKETSRRLDTPPEHANLSPVVGSSSAITNTTTNTITNTTTTNTSSSTTVEEDRESACSAVVELQRLNKQIRQLEMQREQLLCSAQKASHDHERDHPLVAKEQKDWSARFQDICAAISSAQSTDAGHFRWQQINMELLDLSQDFIHTAKTYGRIIIMERYLHRKTIFPLDLGGTAGGDKYLVSNILFKFAVNSNGVYGNDEAAAKVAGHELKGLMGYWNCGIEQLNVPLMALVDFLGFRLIAMSILPIDRSTIVYGTDDCGRTVHCKPPYDKVMASAGQSLNLKSHLCGSVSQGKYLSSAADVEGHLGHDGKFYLIDFARTFPPTAPDRTHFNGHLYQLFRPEFVKYHHVPLCSDAFSGFLRNDPLCRQHNAEVREATQHLLAHNVPRLASALSEVVESALESGQLDQLYLSEHFHLQGVNMRYIGQVLRHTVHRPTAALLLLEAISRVVKAELRQALREEMIRLKVPLMAPYRRLIVRLLNRVFGGDDDSDPDHQQKVSAYWDQCIIPKLKSKFGINAFTPSAVLLMNRAESAASSSAGENPHTDASSSPQNGHPPPKRSNLSSSRGGLNSARKPKSLVLLENIGFDAVGKQLDGVQHCRDLLMVHFPRSNVTGRYLVLSSLRYRTGIHFSPATTAALRSAKVMTAPFDILDLSDILPRTKHTALITNAEGIFYQMKATSAGHDTASVLRKALERFKLALVSNPTNTDTLLNAAQTMVRLLELEYSSGKNMSNLKFAVDDPLVREAMTYFERAIACARGTRDPTSTLQYAKFLVRCGELERAEDYFLKSTEVSPNDDTVLRAYGYFLQERGMEHEALEILHRAQWCARLKYMDAAEKTTEADQSPE